MNMAHETASLKDFANQFSDGIIILDESNIMQWWNHAAGRLFHLSQNDEKKPISQIIQGKNFGAMNEVMTLTLPAAVDKILHLRITLRPYKAGYSFVHIEDTTPTQRLEDMRQDFIANVSHELRTPLTVIRGYLETFLEHRDDRLNAWQNIFSQMHQQAIRMEHIVEELLLLSKLETNHPSHEHQAIDMRELLTTIQKDAIALSADKQQTITLDIQSDRPLYGSRTELHSAFSNLVFNAVHYTPESKQIDLSWVEDEGGGHFIVKDQGFGIAEHHLERITERFYRGDPGRSRAHGGTGLGLAIVKHILIRHRANLRIKSTLGLGSEFICDFSRGSLGL